VGRRKHTAWANIHTSDFYNILYYSQFLFRFIGIINAWKKRSLLSIHGDVTHPEKERDSCRATGNSRPKVWWRGIRMFDLEFVAGFHGLVLGYTGKLRWYLMIDGSGQQFPANRESTDLTILSYPCLELYRSVYLYR